MIENLCHVQRHARSGYLICHAASSPATGELAGGRELLRILHTDGYAAYEKDIGADGMIHACCIAHSRRKFIDALKVQTKAKATDPKLERVVVLMDGLFAIDREAREQRLSLDDRHALRQERANDILAELHALLLEMKQAGSILPKSIAGKAISYTLTRWEKLTLFIKHPVVELSTNWAENSMRPIAIVRSLCPSF